MAIFNLGSINIDHVYQLPHFPAPGETLASSSYQRGLGGKGANQSVAAARAGARVVHLGAIGPGDDWVIDRLSRAGVDCGRIARIDVPTGHAIIYLDGAGENQIVLFPGANRAMAVDVVDRGLADAQGGDLLLIQNETAHAARAAAMARARGMAVIASAAPFDAGAVAEVLPHVTTLALNAVEAAQLRAALGRDPDLPEMLVTLGAEGAELRLAGGQVLRQAAFAVDPVDTTGAGDTFAGYFAAARDAGAPHAAALRLAAGAAALKVTRAGAADAIPSRDAVEAFLKGQP
ncbi:PfkB family carbohydrate kinase [Paracoccus sp. p3-h83]|uniref:PfkB family carbohydrate kinase n=1 Tax=Paracoccus sp. p3-h83 TaxID=3342805 RepID=UPI0035B7D408